MSSLRNLVVLGLLSISGCTANGRCGSGEPAGDFCAYSTSSAIVIEGGFECPTELPVEIAFQSVILCGPSGSTPAQAESVCLSSGYECGAPSCAIAPERDDCVPSTALDGGIEDAGIYPCDAGPIDFCRMHLPEFGPTCCGEPVGPYCLIGGGGYACPEGSIETTECGTCL